MASKPAFKYRGRTDESVQRRAKQQSGAYDSYVKGDVLWFKPKEGENQIRIMPRGPDEDFEKWGDHWGIDIHVHYGVGPDNGTYLCTDKMKGEPCPVCEARRTTEDPDEADQMKPSTRILCWLIDRNDEKAGPKLWSMPLGTSKDVSAVSQVKGSGEVLLIDDPEEGFDVYFDREGEKLRTKYKRVEVARDASPLHDDTKLQDRWLQYIVENPLSEILVFFDAEHVEKVLFGQGKDKDEVESPRRGGRGEAGARGGRGESDEREQEDRSPRRGSRDREDPKEDDAPPSRSSRRGREEPPEDDALPARGARRGAPAEDPPEDDAPPARGARRGSREEPPEEDAEPPARGRTERVRPKEDAPEDDDADTGGRGAAKERLSRLGRRNR